MNETIAIVGAGLVGQGWAVAFARARHRVRVFDQAPADKVRSGLKALLDGLQAAGLYDSPEAALARIEVVPDLASAVSGADYVQESVFEKIGVKREISQAIDAHLAPHAVVGSSTSGFPGSAFTEACRQRGRFLVVHPVNPPHLVPLVEIVPAPWTDPEVPGWVRSLMDRIGQSPVNLTREIPGFVLNRLQGALLDEAFALLGEGYATAEDIDRAVRDGLGLRWAFMGPFETIDLNAPEGLADYARRLGPMYAGFAGQRQADRTWSDGAVAQAEAERRAALPSGELDARRLWRDARLAEVSRLRAGIRR